MEQNIKEDELWFMSECFKYISDHGRGDEDNRVFFDRFLTPRLIININPDRINYKRAWKILEKWDDNGWYEYGVSLDLGWITEEGHQHFADILRKPTPASN